MDKKKRRRCRRLDAGFLLLEAVLSIVIISICLTFIVQSLLTNFRTGMRFQEAARSLAAMENTLGLLYATDASQDQLDWSAKPLEKPYEQFTVSTQADTVNEHLKNVRLQMDWPSGAGQGHLQAATIIYNPNLDENPNSG